jgi:hypothetical protein
MRAYQRVKRGRSYQLDNQVDSTLDAAVASVQQAKCLLQIANHQLSADRLKRGFALLQLARDSLDHSAWILGSTLGEPE